MYGAAAWLSLLVAGALLVLALRHAPAPSEQWDVGLSRLLKLWALVALGPAIVGRFVVFELLGGHPTRQMGDQALWSVWARAWMPLFLASAALVGVSLWLGLLLRRREVGASLLILGPYVCVLLLEAAPSA